MLKKYKQSLLSIGGVLTFIVLYMIAGSFEEKYPRINWWIGCIIGVVLFISVLWSRRKKARRTGIIFQPPNDYYIRWGSTVTGFFGTAGAATFWILSGKNPEMEIIVFMITGLVVAFLGITHLASGNIWVSEGCLCAEGFVKKSVRIPLDRVKYAEMGDAEIRIYAERDWFLNAPGFILEKTLAGRIEGLLSENGIRVNRTI